MKVKYEDRLKQKLIVITTDTLVVDVDIAKNYQWARFVDFRGMEHNRALKFKNIKSGFEIILARSREICKAKILQRLLWEWNRKDIIGKHLQTGLISRK